jgi:hypothetical protein
MSQASKGADDGARYRADHLKRRESPILHRHLILSQTFAGKGVGYVIDKLRCLALFLCLRVAAVPSSRVRVHWRAARRGPSLASRSMLPGHAFTGRSTSASAPVRARQRSRGPWRILRHCRSRRPWRVHERSVSQRTGIINQIRAFLLERGPFACRILLHQSCDVGRQAFDAVVEPAPVAGQVLDNAQHAGREDIGACRQDARQLGAQETQARAAPAGRAGWRSWSRQTSWSGVEPPRRSPSPRDSRSFDLSNTGARYFAGISRASWPNPFSLRMR